MFKLLESISNIGITPSMRGRALTSNRLNNQLSILSLIVGVPWGIFYIYRRSFMLPLSILLLFLDCLILWMNFHHHYGIAKTIRMIEFPLITTLTITISGIREANRTFLALF